MLFAGSSKAHLKREPFVKEQLMFQAKLVTVVTRLAVLLFCLSTVLHSGVLYAQSGESIAELKQKAAELTRQTRYTEALPLLEKIAVDEPVNAQMHFYLGFSVL